MSEKASREKRNGRPTALVVSLYVAAAWVVSLAFAAGVLLLYHAIAGEYLGVLEIVEVLACWGAGGALGCLLWLGAWVVRRQYEAAAFERKLLGALQPKAGETEVPTLPVARSAVEVEARDDVDVLGELLRQLRALNTNVLLNDAQREAKRKHRQWQIAERLAAETEEALAGGRFSEADRLLESLIGEVPDDPRYAQLTERLNKDRAATESENIRIVSQKTKDLMAVGSFDEAERMAGQLLDEHPSAAAAIALLDSVRRERKEYVTDHSSRLYKEIQKCAEQRQWRAALAAAKRLLAAYPDCPEADAVMAQIPLMEDNAHIEEVREMRDSIRDLLHRRRFADALRIAQDVIKRFPETKAAGELHDQLPRLMELAESSET